MIQGPFTALIVKGLLMCDTGAISTAPMVRRGLCCSLGPSDYNKLLRQCALLCVVLKLVVLKLVVLKLVGLYLVVSS